MNIRADRLAKAYLWETIQQEETVPIVPNLTTTMPSISIKVNDKDIFIHSRTTQILYNTIANQRCIWYWSNHNQPIKNERADLTVLQYVTKNTQSWNKRWLSKWQCGMQGVGIYLQQWREQNHSQYPRCQTENETVQHVLVHRLIVPRHV